MPPHYQIYCGIVKRTNTLFRCQCKTKKFETDLPIKLTLISFLTQPLVTLTTVRKVYPSVRLWDTAGFVLIIKSLINTATTLRNGWWKWAIVEKMVRKQILKARGESRHSRLERRNTGISESKLTFNITYYPTFQNVRSILEELQILLATDKEHKFFFLA